MGKSIESPKYWHIVRVTSSGETQTVKLPEAESFFHRELSPLIAQDSTITNKDIQYQLFHWVEKVDCVDSVIAEKCLRCYVSSELQMLCRTIVKKFSQSYDHSNSGEYDCRDNQELDQIIDPLRNPNQANLTVQELCVWVLDSSKHRSSLIDKILNTFDPSKGYLSTWTDRLFKGDKNVKHVLLEYGIEFVTDWSRLIHTKPQKLEQILISYGRSAKEIEEAISLLGAFQYTYTTQVLSHHQRGAKYPAPDSEQLIQISEQLTRHQSLTEEEIRQQLTDLAKIIRQYRVHKPKPIQPSVSEYSESDRLDDFLKHYQSNCLTKAVSTVIETRMEQLAKGGLKGSQRVEEFKQIIQLYYCEKLSTKKIAKHLGIGDQSTAYRRLNRSQLQADIRRNLLHCLSDCLFEKLGSCLTPDQLKKWDIKIQAFLEPKVTELIQEADRQAQTGKSRCLDDPLSVAICQYITQKLH